MSGANRTSPEYVRARNVLYEYVEAIRRESLVPAKSGIAKTEKTEFITALYTITRSSKMLLAFSDKIAATADDLALGRLATVLEHATQVLAAGTVLSRYFDEPTATHALAAKKQEIARRRALKAEDDDATLAIARPLILKALGANGRVTNRDKLLVKINAALTATIDRKGRKREGVDLRTLSRWITKVKKDKLTACHPE